MYAIEGAALGVFLIVAIVVTAIIEDAGSPVRQMIDSPLVRRAIIGVAYLRLCGWRAVHCAKLQHPSAGPCHFNCTPP
jgi:hypothetical protein